MIQFSSTAGTSYRPFPLARLVLTAGLTLSMLLFTGCGEEAVEGKPAVGYGTAVPAKTSPITNDIPPPPPLEAP